MDTRPTIERPAANPASTRLPFVVYVLAVGTFLMGTTEFIIAGLLPEIAVDLDVTPARAGLLITVFAIGMIVGTPGMAILTLRLPRRTTLTLALAVFAVGHVVVAVGSGFTSAAGGAVPHRLWPPVRSGRSRPWSPAAPPGPQRVHVLSASSWAAGCSPTSSASHSAPSPGN